MKHHDGISRSSGVVVKHIWEPDPAVTVDIHSRDPDSQFDLVLSGLVHLYKTITRVQVHLQRCDLHHREQ